MEEEREKMTGTTLLDLPEGRISHILSLTNSPSHILRSSLVRKFFHSAANSNLIWEKFLPSENPTIERSSSVSPRDMALRLCRSFILLKDATKSFSLDRWSGKKSFMFGAKSLRITWGDTPEYWCWLSMLGSRFPDNAELRAVCWLEIRGQIPVRWLSPNTNYGIYFVFKLKAGHTGLSNVPVTMSISEADESGLPISNDFWVTNSVYLNPTKPQHIPPPVEVDSEEEPDDEPEDFDNYTGNEFDFGPEYFGMESAEEQEHGDLPRPTKREDEWMEIMMGTYEVGTESVSESLVLEMTLRGIEHGHWKRGLVVEGVEIRPLL